MTRLMKTSTKFNKPENRKYMPPGRRKDFDDAYYGFDVPEWLGDKVFCSSEPAVYYHNGYINAVYLDNFRKVVTEYGKNVEDQEIYECHLYDLDVETLDRPIQGCKKNGATFRIMKYSHPNPNHTIAIRFKKVKKLEVQA
jgi:hypothetical protein